MAHKQWVPLESSPDVINPYADKLGLDLNLSRVAFNDVFGLDPELLGMVPRCAAYTHRLHLHDHHATGAALLPGIKPSVSSCSLWCQTSAGAHHVFPDHQGDRGSLTQG